MIWYNKFFIVPLHKSPLHFFVSGFSMLITYKGKKSGKTLTVPVGYMMEGDTVTTTSKKNRVWWRNLRGGADVTLTIKGKTYPAHAAVEEGFEEVLAYFGGLFAARPNWANQFGVGLDDNGKPIADQVSKLAAESVIITSKLI